MNISLQGSTNNTTISPLFDQKLAEIEQQLALWDQQFGDAIISQWLFDVAFHRLYRSNGFESANELLTQTRRSLRRSEGSVSLDWRRRCKKAEAQAKAEGSEQPQVEAA